MHSSLRNFQFNYENIIIGSTLQALLYSFSQNIPFITCKLNCPAKYDYLNHNYDLSFAGIQNKIKILKSPSSSKKVGIEKITLWNKLNLYLSICGLNLMSNRCASIRIENDIIKAFTDNARMSKFKFKNIILFDDYNVFGLPPVTSPEKKVFLVKDFFIIKTGMNIPYDYIETRENFVKEIIFYPTTRISGANTKLKDIFTISRIEEQNINDYEWSDVNARFKILYILKHLGFRGRKNGNGQTLPIKIETKNREIQQLTKNAYDYTENLKVDFRSVDDILKNISIKNSELSRLIKYA